MGANNISSHFTKINQTMNKIATHDSASSERPANIISWLLIPFARTQSKTIAQQYAAGCRSFDIRVRKYKGEWHCAHGLYVTKKAALDIFAEIASFADRCQVCITYEGKVDKPETLLEFSELAEYLRHRFAHIIWGAAAIKYGSKASGVKVAYTMSSMLRDSTREGNKVFFPWTGEAGIHTYPFRGFGTEYTRDLTRSTNRISHTLTFYDKGYTQQDRDRQIRAFCTGKYVRCGLA